MQSTTGCSLTIPVKLTESANSGSISPVISDNSSHSKINFRPVCSKIIFRTSKNHKPPDRVPLPNADTGCESLASTNLSEKPHLEVELHLCLTPGCQADMDVSARKWPICATPLPPPGPGMLVLRLSFSPTPVRCCQCRASYRNPVARSESSPTSGCLNCVERSDNGRPTATTR